MSDFRHHVDTALDALQRAISANQDDHVGRHISEAVYALTRVKQEAAASGIGRGPAPCDPYEMDDLNSAI